MKRFQANSRQHSVVLDLVLQRRQLLCDGLAFLDLLAVLLGGYGFVHIIDSTSLAIRCVSIVFSSHKEKTTSPSQGESNGKSHTMIMGHLSRAE